MSEAEGIHDPSYRRGQIDTLEWLREKLGEPNLPTLTACGKRIADLRARLAEVEADRDALARENRRLREIVDRLPKTADGVPTYPGMKVWTHGGDKELEVGRWLTHPPLPVVHRTPAGWEYAGYHLPMPTENCYSTKDAALAPAAVEQDGAREGT